MNYSDLFVVLILAAGLYGLIVALARQRSFLTKAVNPYRVAWVLAAVACLWVGLGLLRLEASSWEPADLVRVLRALVTDTPLSTRGKVAFVALLLGLMFLVLVAWCWLNFPRDPGTFRRPDQRGKALRYYVTKLRGGLDYAVLMRPGGERVEEAWHERDMRATLPHFPRASGSGGPVARTVDDQISFWRAAAERLHQSMPALDDAIAPARHGANRRIVFDVEYGGLFFAYLRPPGPGGEALYLFAATLSQEAMNEKQADAHFDLLLRALQRIDANVRVA
jgi:hypothetical protein